MIIYIILTILLISNIILFTYIKKEKEKFNKEKKKNDAKFQSEIQQRVQKALEEKIQKDENEIKQQLQNSYDEKKKQLDLQYDNDIATYRKSEQIAKDAIKSQENRLEEQKSNEKRILEEYKQKLITQIQLELSNRQCQEFEEIKKAIETYIGITDKRKNDAQKELDKIIKELDEYRTKREAINEEILRQRAIEEKQDFYRICLPEEIKNDIEILNSIKQKLSKFDNFQKFIYDIYISKYAKEMIKRVLGNQSLSGIYKITNTKTQEAYVGKSTNISTRWTNHIKAACGLSGCADSMFQRALKKYGIDVFTWELLEEVDKDKLAEREKYYINLYQTNVVGYNERVG